MVNAEVTLGMNDFRYERENKQKREKKTKKEGE